MNGDIYLEVALLPSLIAGTSNQTSRGAVVIDALRFTTTAAQAFQAGAASVRVVQDIEDARLAKRQSNCQAVMLCGERHCRPIDGFDLGNSPLEYTKQAVSEKQLIFSTTNGTRAVGATENFSTCYLAGFVNRSAIAAAVLNSKIHHWTIVCAGTDGEVAGEDVLAAGSIAQLLSSQVNTRVHLVNDSARLAVDLWLDAWSSKLTLSDLLETFAGGYNLVQTGYRDDIRFAAQVDIIHCVPSRLASGHFGTLR